MQKQPNRVPSQTLRDAYKVPGFRVRARIDSYDALKPPAFVLTLERHSKKRGAAGVGKFAAVFMANAGGECGISVVEIGKSISSFKCAAYKARPAA